MGDCIISKRVLDQAQRELKEHCDIEFSYESIRERRKVKAIVFIIKKNLKFQKSSEPIILLDESLSSKLQLKFDNFSCAKEKAYYTLLDFKMRSDTIIEVLIPSLSGGTINGFEDIFVELILKHFKKNANSPKPDVLFAWWVKKGIYTGDVTWSKLNKNLSTLKKELERTDPDAFFNRLEAKNMTAIALRDWYAKRISREYYLVKLFKRTENKRTNNLGKLN